MDEAKGRRILVQPRRNGAPIIRRDTGAPGELDGPMAQLGFYRCRGIGFLQARLSVNATQDQIADALGVTQAHISLIQNSRAFIDRNCAERILAALAQIAQADGRTLPPFDWRQLVTIPDGFEVGNGQGNMAARAATA